MTVGRTFTTTYKGLSNTLKNNVLVGVSDSNSEPTQALALWDTGATRSVINKNVAGKLDLQPVSIQPISTASGDIDANCYYVDLYLPNHILIQKLFVYEGTLSGCDMLIGMDIIGIGDFAVTNYMGKTVFSFRIPSCTTIDFTKHSHLQPITKEKTPGRNELCPCGSGKKYKNCCGQQTN
jgi:hypothetical protein